MLNAFIYSVNTKLTFPLGFKSVSILVLYDSVNSGTHYQHFLYFAFPKWWLAFVSWSFKHAVVEVAVCYTLLTAHGPYHHPVWKLLLRCFGLAACQSYPAPHAVWAWIAETERLHYFNKWQWNGYLCIVQYLKLIPKEKSTICAECQVSVSGFGFCQHHKPKSEVL